MPDRADKNTAPAPAGQTIASVELATVIRKIAEAWREHCPRAEFVPDPRDFLVVTLLTMRAHKRGEIPGARTFETAEMERYVGALRTVAELAPGLHASLVADLAKAEAFHTRPISDTERLISFDFAHVTAIRDHLAAAIDFSDEGRRTCGVLRYHDLRAAWHLYGKQIGEWVAHRLEIDARRLSLPAPGALTNPESATVRLAIALLGIGGIAVSGDAFAALHKSITKSTGRK